MQLETVDDLLVVSLSRLHDAERRLASAWSAMAEAASAADLKQAFTQFVADTDAHVAALEAIFEELEAEPDGSSSEAMAGIAREAKQSAQAEGSTDFRDAALICAARAAKHYEIAHYECLRIYARQAGRPDLAQRFQTLLQEEKDTDQQLVQLMERSINIQTSGG